MTKQKRTVFYLSDRTGITAETLGHSLLTQFDGIEWETVNVPFLDEVDEAPETAQWEPVPAQGVRGLPQGSEAEIARLSCLRTGRNRRPRAGPVSGGLPSGAGLAFIWLLAADDPPRPCPVRTGRDHGAAPEPT